MWNEVSAIDVHEHSKSVSVLDNLPKLNSSTIVKSVLASINDISRSMDSQSDVDWCLDVLIHGLTDPSLVPDTIMVFSDWLSVLLPYPSSNIPKYILTECNFMSRKMFRILYRLFATVNGIFKKYTFKGRYTYTYTDLAKPCELRGYIKGFLALLWFCFFLG